MSRASVGKKLPRSFYKRPTVTVAEDLIGRVVAYDSPDGLLRARIVEVEAYVGTDDPACHAARGKTERNAVMFGEPGHAYIYFIYGMYHCLNFVTEPSGIAAAVLLRAAEPLDGEGIMSPRANTDRPDRILNGPGKFCRAFGLTRDQNGLDLVNSRLYLEPGNGRTARIERSRRIGIRVGTDRLWRFFDADSSAVSHCKKTIVR